MDLTCHPQTSVHEVQLYADEVSNVTLPVDAKDGAGGPNWDVDRTKDVEFLLEADTVASLWEGTISCRQERISFISVASISRSSSRVNFAVTGDSGMVNEPNVR